MLKGSFTYQWGIDEFSNNFSENCIGIWGETIKLGPCLS